MTEDDVQPTTLREDLELLHSLVQDIAKMTPKLKSITNMMLFEAMKKSLDDMTMQQNQLITAIIERSADTAAQERFSVVRQRIERLEAEIQACTEIEEIKRLGEDIEQATDAYSRQFQAIVKGIVDAKNAQPSATEHTQG